MDARELLKTWPGWAKAGAETILASPAWRMSVLLGDEHGVMRFGDAPLADTIDLDIALDDEPHVLSLVDSPRYPDLHLLWRKRDGLPPEVVLALLERECGDVFALLEKSTRRLVRIRGLAASPQASARVLTVETQTGSVSFAVDLPPEVRTLWGQLDYLDPAHPSIREQTRIARVDYCSLILTEDECRSMTAGDHILIPESFAATQRWVVEDPDDEALHLCSPDTREISFGAFMDESLPPIPDPSTLVLMRRNQVLHSCSLAHLGVARTILIS